MSQNKQPSRIFMSLTLNRESNRIMSNWDWIIYG